MAIDMLKFVPKAERERLQAEAEKRQHEERKRSEQELKARKKEFLKSASSNPGMAVDTVDTCTDHHLSQSELELVKARHLGQPQVSLAKPQVDKRRPFDYDYAVEDTGTVEYATAPSAPRQGRDPLALLDKRLPTTLTHWKQKLAKEMTDRDWKIFREDFKIFVSGGRAPVPFRSWSESALPRDLLNAITKAGYTKPTPIQMQAIPIAMMPRDLIGISSTGSGKTAAFVLPMLFYLKSLPAITSVTAADGPYALVMAPSRELALQIEQESLKFSTFCKIRVCSIVGGRSAEQQTLTLSQGVEMIVATPGRLADSLDGNQTVLNQCFYVVLDEADKMVDLGFEPYLNRILESIPTGELANGQRRITQMFSATMPVSVERLTRKYLVNPLTVTVGEFVGGAAKSEIEQRLEFTRSETEKRSKLYAVAQATEAPIIVFVNSKAAADRVGLIMDNAGYRVMVLHSGKMQQKREEAIGMFKAGSADVLVATDVAGRGIDVPDVQHVINYDLPTSIEDYTHRIGRTGRAGKSGLATSFVSPYDEPLLPELKKFMLAAKQFIPEELERVHVERNEDIGVKRKRDGVVYAK